MGADRRFKRRGNLGGAHPHHVSVDVKESESAYIYNSTSKGKKLGSVSGLSQGLNLIEDLDDGWSLVEAYRNEDGAFVRGYIRTKTLRTVEPNTLYGIVVDKAAQTLTVYKNGERLGSCAVSTVWRPRNTCTAKRPPANTSPSPAAAPSKTRRLQQIHHPHQRQLLPVRNPDHQEKRQGFLHHGRRARLKGFPRKHLSGA